jgi:hypothetical protein
MPRRYHHRGPPIIGSSNHEKIKSKTTGAHPAGRGHRDAARGLGSNARVSPQRKQSRRDHRYRAEAQPKHPRRADRYHGLFRRLIAGKGHHRSASVIRLDTERQSGPRFGFCRIQLHPRGLHSRHRARRLRLQLGSRRGSLPRWGVLRADGRRQSKPHRRRPRRSIEGAIR